MLAHRTSTTTRRMPGEIGAGHTVTALYEIVPPGQPIDGGRIDPLKYQDVAKAERRREDSTS